MFIFPSIYNLTRLTKTTADFVDSICINGVHCDYVGLFNMLYADMSANLPACNVGDMHILVTNNPEFILFIDHIAGILRFRSSYQIYPGCDRSLNRSLFFIA